jgi:glycosyltransferase involved in cell wall biosynthesis
VHLTALVDSEDYVCCRYRLAAFRPWLEQAGHRLEFVPYPRSWWARFGTAGRSSDVVILQRHLPQPWLWPQIRRAARFLVFDFDDAVFLRDSYSRQGLYSLSREIRFRSVIRSVDAVVAGNAFLAVEATRRAGKTRPSLIELIPTCVDPYRYNPAEHTRSGPGVELVWIGSSSTLQGLERVKNLLENVGRCVPGLRLKMICDRFLRLDSMPVLALPWSESGEAAALATADIGISWVPDDLWSRGKCGLKVLQYMAAGLPVVANPVGVHVEMVRHGETGFLARTAEEWREAVARLATDPGLRHRFGQAGRRRLEAEYGVAVGARRWLRLLEELRRQSQTPPRREAA